VKLVEFHDIFAVGPIVQSTLWARAWEDVRKSIAATDWPHGTGSFLIYPQSGKKRGEGNGVDPIKKPCIAKLRSLGWETECLPNIPNCPITTGDLDALLTTEVGNIGFEWETGNISSSHRAINKLILTHQRGGLIGGFLVVPSDKMKPWLTDRIGNIGELRPYFALWNSIPITNSILRVVVVEQDGESFTVPRIPKRTDGRGAS
jgi:hypothetical protein